MSLLKRTGVILSLFSVMTLLSTLNLIVVDKTQFLAGLSFKIGDYKKALTTNHINNIVYPSAIYFTGDVMLGRHVETLMERYGISYPYKNFNFGFNNNYLIGNFEASVPVKHNKTNNNALRFSVDEKYLSKLNDFGFTHFSLANNHSYDFGESGFNNTSIQLLHNQIKSFGHPLQLSTSSIQYIYTNKRKIAIVGINAAYKKPDSNSMKQILNEANKNSEIQIVFIHWGEEYIHKPNKQQKTLASELIKMGVDLIIGHHPHVVQSVEVIDNKLVFYSLGNFIFDQYFSENVQEGMMIKLSFEEKSSTINIIPISTNENLSQLKIMSSDKKRIFLTKLSELSNLSIKSELKTGTLFLDQNLATL